MSDDWSDRVKMSVLYLLAVFTSSHESGMRSFESRTTLTGYLFGFATFGKRRGLSRITVLMPTSTASITERSRFA